jgi:predicted kinase
LVDLSTETEKPFLIIVAGPSAAGKSTLAQQLATHLELPLIQKDAIKETLCDILECTTLAQSQQYGKASMALLYQIAEVVLKSGQSCIIESNFHPVFAIPEVHKLQQRCPFSIIQIHCTAEVNVLVERLKRRWEAGERHPGHMEHLRNYQHIPQEFLQPLALDGQLIKLDTTDFTTINYEQLFERIRSALRSEHHLLSSNNDDTEMSELLQ